MERSRSPRRVVMLSLDSVVRFDNKSIIAAKDSASACWIAEHLLARLEHHKAPRRYFELALKEGLLKRDEVKKKHSFFMFDKSVLSVAIRFGLHATEKTKEHLIDIAGYFGSYWFFRQTVATLRKGPLTQEEFIDMAKCYDVSSSTMDDDAREMIRSARIAHGKEFADRVVAALEERYKYWNDLP